MSGEISPVPLFSLSVSVCHYGWTMLDYAVHSGLRRKVLTAVDIVYDSIRAMNTWAPLWSSIVDSSIWHEPDHVCKIFITMLAIKDADHVVRHNAFQIANKAHKTEKEVIEALKILAAPDKRRLEPQPFDGRRIERVEDGWLVLNGQKYREMMSKIIRREQKRVWASENRSRATRRRPQTVPIEKDEHAHVKNFKNGVVDEYNQIRRDEETA